MCGEKIMNKPIRVILVAPFPPPYGGIANWSLLLKKYHNNEFLALAAYNAGRGNVDEWIEELGWKEDFSSIEGIPFPETREFVKSVVAARDRLEEESK